MRPLLTSCESRGIGATTFDAIANEAGVTRSTLYRNWPTREALLQEAIEEQAPFPAVSSGEPAIARLEASLQEIAAALGASSWARYCQPRSPLWTQAPS
jgi:hypothetical protein